MPRVRITFERLTSPEHYRRLLAEEVGDAGTRETLLSAFRDDTAIVSVASARGTKFTTQVLDSLGRLIIGSDETFKFFPATQPPAPDTTPITIDKPEVWQGEGPFAFVNVVEVNEVEVKATTGNVFVPEEDAADETPTGNPEQVSNVVATSGNVQVKTEVEKDYLVEVRVSDQSVADPSDALHATTVRASKRLDSIKVPLCAAPGQRVWMQRYDPDGCRQSDWVFEDFTIHEDETFLKEQDFSNNWGTGIIENIYSYPSMVDNAGNLEINEVPSMFALDLADGDPLEGFPDSIFSMDEGPGMYSMEGVFPYGRFEAPSVDAGAPHDFYPQVCPTINSMDRITERSIFSEEYHMFGSFNGPSGGVPHGQRAAIGAKREINMFGTQSDGAPLRVLTEVNVDSAGYKVWKPGQRRFGQVIQPRFTLFSHRGLRAPSLIDWTFSRWIRNRKWEFRVPFDSDTIPSPTPGVMTIPIPQFANSVVGLEVQASVETPQVDGVRYNVETELDGLGNVLVSVEQVIRITADGTAGAWNAIFPKAFDAAPTVTAVASDPTNFSYAGYIAKTAAAVNGYIMYPPGTTAAVALPGDGPVDVLARGTPVDDSTGGDVIIVIQVMGG